LIKEYPMTGEEERGTNCGHVREKEREIWGYQLRTCGCVCERKKERERERERERGVTKCGHVGAEKARVSATSN
jgi:hypothetical protein